MRDLWTRRITSLLLGGLIGVYTPETARFIVLGAFLLIGIRLGFWRPRDFFGPMVRSEIVVLMMGILVGIFYGFTGSMSLERPLVLNRIQVTGELIDWTVNTDGAEGIVKILEPIPIKGTSEQETSWSIPRFVSPNKTVETDLREKKYRLKVYPNSEGELPEGWGNIQPGDILQFTGNLEHPKPPGTAGQFDLPLYNAVRGIAGSITAQGDAELVSPGNPPLRWVVLTHVRELFEQIPSAQTGLLEGILFGDTSRIPEEDLERYRVTGVYHVFSASGSNVAFLLALCWGALKFLPIPLRIGISIVVLSFYALLSGGNPPILRATVMGILVLMGRLGLELGKGLEGRSGKGAGKGNSLRNLFIAALILFIWQPLNLKDIGFQLSFMATWGIIVLSPRIVTMRGISRLPHALKIALATTGAAQIATLPLLVTAFHRLSFIGWIANIAVLFLIGSIFEIGMIGVILSFLPILALSLFQVSLWLLAITNEVLFQLAQVPSADAWVINPGIPFWVAWYSWIVISFLGWERVKFTIKVWGGNINKGIESRWGKFFLSKTNPLPLLTFFGTKSIRLKALSIRADRIFLALLVFLLLWSPWNTPRALEVTFIDVGQGDSILIETQKGKRILVDTGPKSDRFDAGERIIVPYLLNRGIKHLDALLLTHSHVDHVGGAAAVLETIPVDWVGIPADGKDWLSGESVNGEKSSPRGGGEEESGLDPKLVKILSGKKMVKLTEGDRFILDSETQLYVIAPGEILTGTHSDDNNNSLVLQLENQAGQTVLLTADMEQEAMEAILKTGQDFSADLFKVPHHGSRFSLDVDWLDQIDPQAVVIPVGKNTFGHPNSGVLKYWEERRVPIYRTDEDGTIRVRMDERGIEVIPGRG